MTPRLIVMRHATAGQTESGQSDHQRKLTDYGEKETILISEELSKICWIPDIALVSSSTRTRETHSFLMPIPIEVREEIYQASLEILLSIVENLHAEKTTLLLGHNPGCELLTATLSGNFHSMPPASCALFRKAGEDWILEKMLKVASVSAH